MNIATSVAVLPNLARMRAQRKTRYRVHRCTLRVTELVPGRKVAWLVLDNHFNFIEDQAEWKDTRVVFEISDKDGGAEIQFTHLGLVPRYECYDVCSNAWSVLGTRTGSEEGVHDSRKGQGAVGSPVWGGAGRARRRI